MSELEQKIALLRTVGRFIKGRDPEMTAEDGINCLTRVVTFMREQQDDLSALDVKYHDAQNRADDADMWRRRFEALVEDLGDVERGLLEVAELRRITREKVAA